MQSKVDACALCDCDLELISYDEGIKSITKLLVNIVFFYGENWCVLDIDIIH